MTITEKKFEVLAAMYEGLIELIMSMNGIVEIRCENEKEHFFDRMVLENGELLVYKYKTNTPFHGLCFDFTLDYATCLHYIEHDFFLFQRKGKSEKGMYFTLSKEKRR